MEATRTYVEDSLFALISTYMIKGSHDIMADYDTNWNGQNRVVQVDDIQFKIARKQIGEKQEIPGVNLLFYDEHVAVPLHTNPRGLSRLFVIHVYIQATKNTIADS